MLTRAQVLADGFSDEELATMIARRQLIRLHRGVYALGGSADTLARQLVAATLALGDGFASHGSALELHRLARPPELFDTGPELTVAHGVSRKLPGLLLRRSRILPEGHRCRVQGVPCLSVCRTICDLAPLLTDQGLARLVDDTVVGRRMTIDELAAVFESTDRGRRAGRPALRRVLSERLSGEGIPESELERRFLAMVEHEQLPMPVVQGTPAWLPNPDGRVDFVYPEESVVVEVDGRRHLTEQQKEIDTRRDHAASMHRWTVLRFTWRQVVHDPTYVADVVRAILALAAPSG